MPNDDSQSDVSCPSSCSTCYSQASDASLNSGADPDQCDDASEPEVKNYPQDQLPPEDEGYHQGGIDLVEFAVATWGFDRSKAESIRGHRFQLSEQPLTEYVSVCTTRCKREHELHAPFLALADQLLDDVASFLGETLDDLRSSHVWWNGKGVEAIASLHGNCLKRHYRKPCLVTAFTNHSTMGATWEIVKSPIILKRDLTMLSGHAVKLQESSALLDHRTLPTTVTAPTTRPAQETGSKRRLSEASHGNGASLSLSGKRQKMDRASREARVLLSPFALEALSCTSRHYIVGVYILNCEFTLVYFDHMRVLQTRPFNFRADPGALALVLFGLCHCDRPRAGMDPMLRALLSHVPAPLTAIDSERALLPVADPIGLFYEFEHASGEDCRVDTYQLTGIIRKSKQLIGRATSVYSVTKISADDPQESEESELVLKLTWPIRLCPSEIDIVANLKKELPVGLSPHLPSIISHASHTAEHLELPWTKISGLPFIDADKLERTFRASVSPVYTHIWEADSLEDFMQGWLDCVEVHYHAYKAGKVLHRDISENNLMLHRGKDGALRGVLNDWDMSSKVDADGQILPVITHHLIGTLPFMAHQLLRERPIKHLYRHDLESFFYVLVWAAILYDFRTKRRGVLRSDSCIQHWVHTDLDKRLVMDHRNSKSIFLFAGCTTTDKLETEIRPENMKLYTQWIQPLHILFRRAEMDRNDHCLDAEYDTATCGGILTFESFLGAIGREPRSFDTVIDAEDL